MGRSTVSNFRDFMASDAGAQARYKKRQRRRVHITIDDIEPQSKKMSAADRDKFQNAVAKQLTSIKRSTFRGDVALRLDLATTSKNAPQAHTITKNLLDLLGARRPGVSWSRRRLLYDDDRQIQALSVSCRHGENRPDIEIEARPFAAMLDDLELAAEAARVAEMKLDTFYREEQEAQWVDTFRDLVRNEEHKRRSLGDDLYDGYLRMVRWSAQGALLGRSSVNTSVLSWMYGLPKYLHTGTGKEMWAQLIGESNLRLQFGELPIATGGSDVFKQNVADEIAAFKQRWSWIIDPLVVPVALEVVVRPNPKTPPAVLHDLDNTVRNYLLPGIVPSFGTVSDRRWTIDFDELKQRNPTLAASWGPNPTPPPGTRSGVTRYEAWRLPAATGQPGFVSVALVADMDAKGSLMDQVDQNVREWIDRRSQDRCHLRRH